MSFWDDITGKTASEAANAAAADTYQKQQAAIAKLTGYGDQYADKFNALYSPYSETGATANSALARLLADPSSVRSLPGYSLDLEEGTRAIDRSAAARGMDQSGRTLKDLQRFGTGLADRTLQSQFQRLLGGTGVGLSGNAGIGTGLQGQLGTRTSAYQGDMASAGTIGQGMVAGANAESAGASNLLNAGLKLGSMALGGFGGMGGLGGWINPDSFAGGASRMLGGGLSGTEWYNR